MANYTLSREADADFDAIARDSLANWGEEQAEPYLQALFTTAKRLAEFPELGRDVSHLHHGLMRMVAASHVILYQRRDGGIRIIRILHARMDVVRHL